jgi:hypothetical protein
VLAQSQVKDFGSRSDDGDSAEFLARREMARACVLNKAERGELTMNTNPVLWLQAYLIGVLVFLISITAITEHPEWFN